MVPDWLPELCTLETCDGNWEEYVEMLYQYYCDDFHQEDLFFLGKRVKDKWHPPLDGKSATFWHIVTSGNIEVEREPDLRRCERILWPRAIIENYDDPLVRRWENRRRKKETRVLLWLEEMDYLVVLADRRNQYLIWTAYCVDYGHQRRKLREEYERSQNS